MKAFSLLITQCGSKDCRMVSVLNVADAVVESRDVRGVNAAFLEKQRHVILGLDPDNASTIQRVHGSIAAAAGGEAGGLSASDIERVVDWDLDDELRARLYRWLFGTVIVEGTLECSGCARRYRVRDEIADFVNPIQ